MEGAWWRQRQELDEEQEAVISLPFDGRYIITGPPGCGKTNLLLLRAAFMAKSGIKDQKVLTFGGVLSNFINTGKKELDSNQISTFASWAQRLCHARVEGFQERHETAGAGLSKRARFEAQRASVARECLVALNATGYAPHTNEAIHADEVQDLMKDELRAIVKAAPRVTLAGDTRQSIYHGDAMELVPELGFIIKQLRTHYRIGKKIACVADRLYPPSTPGQSLEATTQYDEKKLESRAEHISSPNRVAQFEAMYNELRGQLRAYPNEALAILIPRVKCFAELREFFSETELEPQVTYHEGNDGAQFESEARIHVMTVAGAKGTEFRAVHLYACEEAQGPQDTHEFWYTAVTRAKTTLLAHSSPSSPPVSAKLRSAFAQNERPTIDSLFE